MSSVEPIRAAGGVLFRDPAEEDLPRVLLIYRLGVWDLPKGKLEEGESIEECAVREVAEETGLHELPDIVGDLPDTYHEYRRGGVHYGKTTHWFAMRLPASDQHEFRPQKEEGIQKLKWVPAGAALEMVGYDNLKEVLQSFMDWHRNR